MKLKLSDIANCCMCGRIVDTREVEDGGDKFGAQSSDGTWTCSFECWDASPDNSAGTTMDDILAEQAKAKVLRPARQALKGGSE